MMNDEESANFALLSHEVNRGGHGKEDALTQLKPYIDTESKLVSLS